jgi:hypothetical protein
MKTKLEAIEIEGIRYVPETSYKPAINTEGLKFAVIRCRDAGVHAGFIKKIDGRSVELINSRRLYRWNSCDNTLSGLSQHGPYSSNECNFATVIPELLLTDMCEVLYCTDVAMEAIVTVKVFPFGGVV